MKIEIIDNIKSAYFYTVRDEIKPKIYKMEVTPKMICDVDETFKGYSLKQAKLRHVINVLRAYHQTEYSVSLPVLDMQKLAKVPSHEAFVTKVMYENKTEIRAKTLIPQGGIYTFLPI